VQFVLNSLLGELVGFPLPPPGFWPVLHGLSVSMLLLLGFALPPLIRLGRVPTLRVLRREWDGMAAREGVAWAIGALLLAGLLVGIARDWLLGAWVVGGFALAFAIYAAVGGLVLAALGRVRGVASSGWRYGIASLRRRPVASLVQVLALGMGLTALLLLTLVRGDPPRRAERRGRGSRHPPGAERCGRESRHPPECGALRSRVQTPTRVRSVAVASPDTHPGAERWGRGSRHPPECGGLGSRVQTPTRVRSVAVATRGRVGSERSIWGRNAPRDEVERSARGRNPPHGGVGQAGRSR